MKAGAVTTRRDAQREATRARLFEETVREFKRIGFALTEVAVVAERVGVSRGAYYVHFAGKDDVLRELLLAEERRIAHDLQPLLARGATLEEILRGVVDSTLRAEHRLGRKLIRDLCAAQFRPDFAPRRDLTDHPLARAVVEAVADRVPGRDPVDFTLVFLTGLFGLLATGQGTQAERRHHIHLLVELVSKGATTP